MNHKRMNIQRLALRVGHTIPEPLFIIHDVILCPLGKIYNTDASIVTLYNRMKIKSDHTHIRVSTLLVQNNKEFLNSGS